MNPGSSSFKAYRRTTLILLRAAAWCGFALLLFSAPRLYAQSPAPCGAANGGGQNSTNFYGKGNPCAFAYSVPADRMNQVLSSANYCSMFSRTQVNCSRPLIGNFGQVQVKPGENGSAGNNNNSTRPAYGQGNPGMAPAQPSSANQLWERASALVDRSDFRDAMPLLLQGARMGDARAQAALGIIYQNGEGLRADNRAAAYWFGLAAAQRHRAAEYALSGMYEDGEGGLPKDRAKAVQLLQDSAAQNYDKAQLALGIDYETGDGVRQNRQNAILLLRKAGAQGYDPLGTHLAIILSDPRTPSHFDSIDALANYLARLRNEAIAANRGGHTYARGDQAGGMARYNAAMEMSSFMRSRGAGNGGNP